MNFLKNKIFVNVVFGIMVFLTMVLFFITYFLNRERIDIPVLGQINSSIRINVEIPKEDIKNVHFYINNHEIEPYIWRNPNTYCAFEINARNIYSIAFKGDRDEDISKIKNIVVFVGDKMFYYTDKDISNFKRTKDGAYIFPSDMKYYKNSTYINDKGPLKHLTFGILSVFYNWQFYMLPLLFLGATCLIYAKNKDKLNLGFNIFKQNAIWFIIFFAFLIRVCDLGFNFWSDELYTITCASYPTDSFIWTFKDPGNPPFFFILAKLWMMIFGISEVKCRMLTVLISTVTIYFTYKFLKDNLNIKNCEKVAILAAFFLMVSIYSIKYAQDYRAYSLGSLFFVLSAYYLFKLLKSQTIKNYVIYAFLIVLMINTHYFQTFVIFGNFIIGIILLKNKEKLKFFFIHLLCALSFVPFFTMTAFNKALMDPTFNPFSKPDAQFMLECISGFFASKITTVIVLFVFICLFIPQIRKCFIDEDNELKKILFYVFYIIFTVFACSYVFSFIRPIIKPFYYVNIFPAFAIILAGICFLPFKNKALHLIISILLFTSFFSGKIFYCKNFLAMIVFNPVVEYAHYDSQKYLKMGKVIGLGVHDTENYFRFFKDIMPINSKIISYKLGDKASDIHDIIRNSNADIIYMRIENKKYVSILYELIYEYEMSVIRCNKDVIVARITKR